MEGKVFKDRIVGRPGMSKSGMLKEERIWRKSSISTDAGKMSKWTKHTGFGKKFGILQKQNQIQKKNYRA